MDLQQKQKINIVFQTCTVIMVYVAFAVAFGVLTGDASYYAPCSTSSSSYQWAYITYVFEIIGCVLLGFFVPIFSFITIKCLENLTSTTSIALLSCLVNFIRFGVGVMSLVCFGGLCHAYGQNENCGKLNNLILAYIIIVSIGLGVGCIAACCMLACGAVLGKSLFTANNLGKMQKELEKMANQVELQQRPPEDHKPLDQESPENKT